MLPSDKIDISQVITEISKVYMTKRDIGGGCLLKQKYSWTILLHSVNPISTQQKLEVQVRNKGKCIYQATFSIHTDQKSCTSIVELDFNSIPFTNGSLLQIDFILGDQNAQTDEFWAFENRTYNRYKVYSEKEMDQLSPYALLDMQKNLNEKTPFDLVYDYFFPTTKAATKGYQSIPQDTSKYIYLEASPNIGESTPEMTDQMPKVKLE
jgi:hypothetical protein